MSYTVFHRQPPTWFDKVAHLLPGQRKRIADGKLVSNNGKGWHLWDFREKVSEVYQPELSLATKLEWMRLAQDATTEAAKSTDMPAGGESHPSEWPSASRAWFWSAGLSALDVAQLGPEWHPVMQRVIVPMVGARSRYWIARKLPGAGTDMNPKAPKYLFPDGVSRTEGALYYGSPDCRTWVLTEDFLSAYRIRRDTGYNAAAVQGTSMGPELRSFLLSHAERVILWLDTDKYGQIGQTAIQSQLTQRGMPVGCVKLPATVPDPKKLEPEFIRSTLSAIHCEEP